jgi:bis(5'-nucleosidyl)-tetraphosphatase
MKESSAGVLLFRQAKKREYLLLLYEEGHWDFPKGHIEKGETEQETAIRELKEETGITLSGFVEGFSEELHYFYTRNHNTVSKKVVFFLGQTKQKGVTLSFEHTAYKWLAYEEALKKLTYKNAQEILKKSEAFLKNHCPPQSLRLPRQHTSGKASPRY